MAMLSLASFLLIFVLSKSASAQTRSHFISPPDAGRPLIFDENVVLTVGNTLQARWSTTLGQYSVWLWQQSLSVGAAVLGSPVYTKILGGPEQGGFNWTISPQAFDLLQSNVFFFALGPTQEITSSTLTSHYFNLTMNSVAKSSASAASSSSIDASRTASTSPASSTSSSPINSTRAAAGIADTSTTASIVPTISSSGNSVVQTQASAASSSTRDNSSNPAKLELGLGVGIPVGMLFLLLGLCSLGVLRRQRRRELRRLDTLPPSNSCSTESYLEKFKPMSPQEMHAYDHGSYSYPPQRGKCNEGRIVIAELPSYGMGRR